ncbi:MAG: hypothetical protein HGA85_04745 [Nanoarchaeota archaeon]|nr:hypothetical protein [Nanoarchaeota archaeon]
MSKILELLPEEMDSELELALNAEGRRNNAPHIGTCLKQQILSVRKGIGPEDRIGKASTLYSNSLDYVLRKTSGPNDAHILKIAEDCETAIDYLGNMLVEWVVTDFAAGQPVTMTIPRMTQLGDLFLLLAKEDSGDYFGLMSDMLKGVREKADKQITSRLVLPNGMTRTMECLAIYEFVLNRYDSLLNLSYRLISDFDEDEEKVNDLKESSKHIFYDYAKAFEKVKVAMLMIPAILPNGMPGFYSSGEKFKEWHMTELKHILPWKEKLSEIGISVDFNVAYPPKHPTA